MLPNAEQKFLAGNTQQIAKHIADKVSGWGVCCYDFLSLPITPYYS